MVVATASGKSFKVRKNMSSAVVPKSPRRSSHFLLIPKNGMPSFLMTAMQNRMETKLLKSTSSCAGIPSSTSVFTNTLTMAKHKTDTRMDKMALFNELIVFYLVTLRLF